MKMILRISATRQKAWRVLEHVYGQGDYAPERNIADRLGPKAWSLPTGYPTGDPHFDAELLLSNHHGRGKEARHVIFSAPEMPEATEEQYQNAVNAMVASAQDFAQKHAPGQSYIVQGHRDRFHPHSHLIICSSNGKKCIDWGPEQLKGFQSLDFLSEATRNKYNLEPGRGQGKRPRGVGRIAYNHAVQGDCQKTLERQTAEQFSYEKIMEGIDAGTIQVARRTKAGKPISVLLGGKKIRLSTLRKSQLKPSTGDSNYDTARPYRPQPHRLLQLGRNRSRGMAR